MSGYQTKRLWYTNGLRVSERKTRCVQQGEPVVVQLHPDVEPAGVLLEVSCWFSFSQKNPRSAKSLCEANQHVMNRDDQGIYISRSLTSKLTVTLSHVANIDLALETLSCRTKYSFLGVTVKFRNLQVYRKFNN